MKKFRKSQTGRTTQYFLKFFKRHKLAVFVNFTFTPLAIFFGETLVGYYVGILFQKIVEFKTGNDTGELYHLGWVIIWLYIIQIIFYRINDYTALWRQTSNLRDLEQYIFKRLPAYGYKFYSNTFGGALVSQVNRYLRSYEEFDDLILFNYLETFSRIILSAIILLFIAPPLGIILAVWSPLFVLAVAYLSAKKAYMTRAASAADSNVIAYLSDAVTNMMTIKSFGRAKQESKEFNKISNDRLKKRRRSWFFNGLIRDFRWLLILAFFIAYILLSIHLVTTGQIQASTVVAGQIYVFSILGSLLSLHQVVQRTEQLFGDAAELTDILDLTPELKDPIKPEKSVVKNGAIVFSGVDFVYADTSKTLFEDLSLNIPAGQKVGLVGHSGSGKSTITRLLLRFMDIQEGIIMIDGQDISRIKQDDLRSSIAYVPQEPLLFHRSLKDNIGYGREGATEQEVVKAAKLAHADEFINNLPQGYETPVGERGVKLSGGERQRVAIARAMLTDAPILVLDEATSALDSKSEKLITDALDVLMKGRTTIVVAHRLSTIKKLDRILVMSNGRIIEDGSHEELLAKGGEYAELWNHQSGNFLES